MVWEGNFYGVVSYFVPIVQFSTSTPFFFGNSNCIIVI